MIEVIMEFLIQQPLIRYIVEILFIISLTAVLMGIVSSSGSLISRWMSSRARYARWKRPDEFGLGCWKLPK
jgi:TctA family transporter